MNILFIGDIVGRPGRNVVAEWLPILKQEFEVDFTIANGENAAGGFGINPQLAGELYQLGVDVLTMGNHVWDKKEILEYIETDARMLRPINFPPGVPGRGSDVFVTSRGAKIAVMNAMGRVYLPDLDCPFRAAKAQAAILRAQTKVILVDFHAEVTSEKRAFGWHLDGDVSAVVGTHTHVMTADEQIMPNGTAYITDVGMTGPHESVIGVQKELALRRFLLHLPAKFEVASGDVKLSAVVIDVDEVSGRARAIQRVSRPLTR